MPTISNPPTAESSIITGSLRIRLAQRARRTIKPWYKNTGSAEKATPIPIVEAKIIADIPSRADLA